MSPHYQPPDSILIAYQLALDGDQDAAAYVYEFFYPRFKQIIREGLADCVRAVCDSEDVLQDAWLALLKAPTPTFTSPRQFIKYLETTVWHKMLETNRKYLKFQRHDLNCQRSLHSSAEICSERPAYRELEISDEEWDILLAKVTPGQRKVLLLLRHGESYEAIGEASGINADHLRIIFRRIIRKHRPAHTISSS